MRTAEVERFTLIPYDEDTFDCADLVIRVQREMFGRDVLVPGHRPRGARGQLTLGELSATYANPVDTPECGDLVLMADFGHSKPSHAGVFFFLAHEPWVLHTNAKTGCSVLHRIREIGDYGLKVEGYYRWNTPAA